MTEDRSLEARADRADKGELHYGEMRLLVADLLAELRTLREQRDELKAIAAVIAELDAPVPYILKLQERAEAAEREVAALREERDNLKADKAYWDAMTTSDRVVELREERDRLKEQLDAMAAVNQHDSAMRDRAEARLTALTSALGQYGQHRGECDVRRGMDCNCGYADALAALRGTTGQ